MDSRNISSPELRKVFENDTHFRVAVFGSARIDETDPVYEEVKFFSQGLALRGCDIITGGGPGLMQAANEGFKSAQVTHDKNLSVGLTITLPFEEFPNKHLDIKEQFDQFSDRLDGFMDISHMAVVMHGGVGTLLELYYTWQVVQVRKGCTMPIVLVGEMWEGLVQWMKDDVWGRGFMSQDDFQHVFLVPHAAQALELVDAAFEAYKKDPGGYCMDAKKFSVLKDLHDNKDE